MTLSNQSGKDLADAGRMLAEEINKIAAELERRGVSVFIQGYYGSKGMAHYQFEATRRHGGTDMSVRRVDHYEETCADGDYVRHEDFDAVLLALRSVHASCVKLASCDPNDTTAYAIRNYLQKIVDQYE